MAHRFELFMGCLENGIITVCNKAVMEHGDYKVIAHISQQGEVKWYVEPGYTPASCVIKIREAAAVQQNKYETWWASLSEAKRYEIAPLRQTSRADGGKNSIVRHYMTHNTDSA